MVFRNLFGKNRLSKEEKQKITFEAQQEVFENNRASDIANFKARAVKKEQFAQGNFFQKAKIISDTIKEKRTQLTLPQRMAMKGERVPSFMKEPDFMKGNFIEGYKKK